MATDPSNPVALKNLGAIFGREGDSVRALYYLCRSYEIDHMDPQTVHGLAFAYMVLGDTEPAQNAISSGVTAATDPSLFGA